MSRQDSQDGDAGASRGGTGPDLPLRLRCATCLAFVDATDQRCGQCGATIVGGGAITSAGELKFVTVLRCDLVGSTQLVAKLGPEEGMLRLEPALETMRRVVKAHGGVVCREMGDGVLAVFGAPLASEAHAVSAMAAGFDMLEGLAALAGAPSVRIGAHSGVVVARLVSSEYSSGYDVAGPALHLVERLQACAVPDTIRVSQECRRLSERLVAFEACGAVEMKGFEREVATHRALHMLLSSRSDAQSFRTPCYGRDAELALLGRLLADSARGQGSVACVVGDAGLGKSRLVHEFADAAARAGGKVFWIECAAQRSQVPYSALRQIARALLAAPDAGAFDAADRSLLRPREVLEILMDQRMPDDEWRVLDAKERVQSLAESVARLLAVHCGVGAVAVVVEDVHWVDAASDAVFQRVGQATSDRASALMVATARALHATSWLAQTSTIRIELAPLPLEAGSRMVDSLFGDRPELAFLKARVLRHTGQVPLFIEEVCHQLVESGSLDSADALRHGELAELGVPATAQGVIASRIDRLLPQDKLLVQVAAVIGADCSVEMLCSVARRGGPSRDGDVAHLLRVGLLQNASAAGKVRLSHDLVRQVAYESLLGSTRALWHDRVRDAIEQDESEEPERLELLCHHAEQAADWPRTFRFAREIVLRCIDRSALDHAVRFVDTALAAVDRQPPSKEREFAAIDFRIESRMVLSEVGRIDRWLTLTGEAAQRAAAVSDPERRMRALAARVGALNFHGDAFKAVSEGELALEQALQIADDGWVNYARYCLGQAYFMSGTYALAVEQFMRVHDQLVGPAPRAVAATTVVDLHLISSMMLTLCLAGMGNFEQAAEFEERARSLSFRTPRPYGRVAAGYGSAVLQLSRGEPEAAAGTLVEHLRLARRHNVGLFIPLLECQLGMAQLELSQARQAYLTLRSARARAAKLMHRSAYLRSTAHLAIACGGIGRTRRAAVLAAHAVTEAAQDGYAAIELEALLARAHAQANAQDVELVACAEAAADMRRAEQIARALDAQPMLQRVQGELRKPSEVSRSDLSALRGNHERSRSTPMN